MRKLKGAKTELYQSWRGHRALSNRKM